MGRGDCPRSRGVAGATALLGQGEGGSASLKAGAHLGGGDCFVPAPRAGTKLKLRGLHDNGTRSGLLPCVEVPGDRWVKKQPAMCRPQSEENFLEKKMIKAGGESSDGGNWIIGIHWGDIESEKLGGCQEVCLNQ